MKLNIQFVFLFINSIALIFFISSLFNNQNSLLLILNGWFCIFYEWIVLNPIKKEILNNQEQLENEE